MARPWMWPGLGFADSQPISPSAHLGLRLPVGSQDLQGPACRGGQESSLPAARCHPDRSGLLPKSEPGGLTKTSWTGVSHAGLQTETEELDVWGEWGGAASQRALSFRGPGEATPWGSPLKGRRCNVWGEGCPKHPCGQHRWTGMGNPLPGLPSLSPQECSPHCPQCPRGEAGQVGLPE